MEWVSLPISNPLFVVWWEPPSEWLKVNFDSSVVSSSVRGGADFVGRDHDGKLLLATSAPLQNVSAPLVEMIAAWNAIKEAVFRMGASKLWIEGDALVIILAIRKGSGVDGYSYNLLKDIKFWLQNLEEWKVSHILREGNTPQIT